MPYVEASRGAGAQSVSVKPTGCGFDRVPTEFDEKWRTEVS